MLIALLTFNVLVIHYLSNLYKLYHAQQASQAAQQGKTIPPLNRTKTALKS